MSEARETFENNKNIVESNKIIQNFLPKALEPYNLNKKTPLEELIREVVKNSGIYGEDAAILEYELLKKYGCIKNE